MSQRITLDNIESRILDIEESLLLLNSSILVIASRLDVKSDEDKKDIIQIMDNSYKILELLDALPEAEQGIEKK